MVAPAFGFSVGDFIAGGQILIEVIGAFKEAGGASSKYAAEVSFLNSLKATIDHLERFVSSRSSSLSDDLPQDISKLLQEIREPWEDFKKFLDKYEPSLGSSSSRSKLAKAPRTIQYTLKDISGKVEKLRNQTEQPLQAVNSLLSLHVIQTLEKLPGQLLQPAQCAQLVEAITLADIPTELDKQIRDLKLAADEHNVKQDEQLQIITTLRTQLEERITGLQLALDEIKGEAPTARDRHDEQLNASSNLHNSVDQLSEVLESRAERLESAMKEQKQLVLALKSFLEEKASRPESAPRSSDEGMEESEKQRSWPSATLSTAYFAALLLSSVLSSVAATLIVTRKDRSFRGARPVFLPVDYSLPGLGTLNTIQIDPSLRRPADNVSISTPTTDLGVPTEDQPSTSTQATVSEWLDNWSSLQTLRQIKEEPKGQRREKGGFLTLGLCLDWSSKASKLDNPGKDDGPDEGHGGVSDSDGIDDGSLHDGPGPFMPSTDDEGFDWGGISFDGGGGGESGGGGGGGNDSSDDSDSS